MKKIYLLAASFALCTAGMAQIGSNSNAKPLRSMAGTPMVQEADRPQANPEQTQNERGASIWSDDFSDPSTWIFTDQSPSPYGWVITTGPYTSSIQSGTPFDSFLSTTSENGYAFIDSDGSPWTADGQGEVIGQFRTATPIDLTDFPAVSLRYENNYRWFQDTRGVRVSGDNGETWTDFDLTDGAGYPNEQNSENPDIVTINISNQVGGASEVLIEFYYRDNNVWAWYWAVDDVSLFVPDDNDLTIGGAVSGSYDPEVDVDWRNVDYSIYPISQLRPMSFAATATNTGGAAQSDVMLTVSIDGPGGEVNLTSETANIPVGESFTFVVDGYTPPAEVGMYTVTYTISQNEEDSNPDDNVSTLTFMVDDAVYARDRGGSSFIANVGNSEFYGGPGYYIEQDADLYCIGAAISNTSIEGTFFDFELRDGLNIEYLANTDGAQVEASMFNAAGEENYTWLYLEGGATVPLFAGDDYVPMFHHFGGADVATVSIGDNSAPDFTSYLIASYDEQECDPCYTGSTYMVRMGLSQEFCDANVFTNVSEIEMVSVNELYPNPTAGITTLEYTLIENAEVQIFLFDNMGRVVLNKDMGTQTVGEYRFDYDFSNLAAGAYTFTIQANDNFVNNKLVIK